MVAVVVSDGDAVASERTGTDRLRDKVFELVYDGAQSEVWNLFENQIQLNTALERAYGALADEHEAVLSECNDQAQRIAELQRREALPLVVVMDQNSDYSDQLTVYCDGRRIDAKVLTYDSEEDCGDILGRYVRVYRNEYGTPEDWELELPDAWTAEEWKAIVSSDETYLPYLTVPTEPAGTPQDGGGG